MEDKFYLVTFTGVPDWEGEETNSYVERKYLFSSAEKAAEFVRKRTTDKEWDTHPAFAAGSMMHRVKQGEFHLADNEINLTFQNEYKIVALTSDDEDAKSPDNDPYAVADQTEAALLKVEKELERIGQSICDVKGSGNCWSKINLALAEVREAVCETYRMITEG